MVKHVKKIETPDLSQPLTAALIGQAIRAKRTQSNLRLEDAAALCGVAKQTLMKIEHGITTSQAGNVLQICFALGIKLYIEPWRTDEAQDDWQ